MAAWLGRPGHPPNGPSNPWTHAVRPRTWLPWAVPWSRQREACRPGTPTRRRGAPPPGPPDAERHAAKREPPSPPLAPGGHRQRHTVLGRYALAVAPPTGPVAPTAHPQPVWLTDCDRLRPTRGAATVPNLETGKPARDYQIQREPRNRQACQELYATKKVRTPPQPRLCTSVSGVSTCTHHGPPRNAQVAANCRGRQ